jgi:hypothetical protein
MKRKMAAVMVSVLGLAVMATVQRSALPEGISLAVWGIGLIAAGAQVREVIPMGHADAAKTGLIRPKTKPLQLIDKTSLWRPSTQV